MLTPPLVTMTSTSPASRSTAASTCAASSSTWSRSATTRPASTTAAASMWELESWIWPGASGWPGRDQLGAGRDDPDPQARQDEDVAVARRRGQGHPAGVEHLARPQHGLVPARTSSPAGRTERPHRDRHAHLDDLRAAVGVLDLDDRVGAGRHHRAGHDAHRLTGADLAVGDATGRHLAHDGQVGAGGGVAGDDAGDVGRAHGVPVHRGVVEAGQVDPGA